MNVLAFECDRDHATAIRHVVCDVLREGLTVVHSVEDAVQALCTSVPDLVLLPALMPPADENTFLTSLRSLPDGGHIETLVTPFWEKEQETPLRDAPSWWRRLTTEHEFERPARADDAQLFAQRLAWSSVDGQNRPSLDT